MGEPMAVRLAVVRGVVRINFPELGMYAGLRGEGFVPELICSRRSRVTEKEAGMPIRRLRTPPISGRIAPTVVGGYLIGRVSPYRYYHQYLLGFHRAVRDVDVLCPVDLGHPTSYQSVLERVRGKKVVVQCWENIPFNWPHDRPLRNHFEAVLDGADHFLALTDGAERALRTMGVSPDRLSRLNLAVDLDFWTPAPLARGEGAPIEHLYVGRLDWAKGVQVLIEALDYVKVPVRLSIVGEGQEEERLRWLIEQRRRRGSPTTAASIRFLGARWGEELLRIRQRSDVQLVPSIPTPQWREQLSQSLVEGLACGLPAIASDTGAVPEVVVEGENGLRVPPDVPVRWAQAIEYLATHADDRRRMARAARDRTEREYDPTRQVRRLATILREKVLGR